ncbi:MAG: uncharacterized protein KVP18_001764 [Porospora cf. gigantea A]|uniref:uncharacterized protein n=1 Tax=Porospora cf. gigantea A TaxID=2853593 RepID=UPI00355A96DA|nr:MAG: hypothetical protein KVP18_001764 [Porospora cf. gigantea A]
MDKHYTAVVLGQPIEDLGGDLTAHLPKLVDRLWEINVNQVLFLTSLSEGDIISKWFESGQRRSFDLVEVVHVMGVDITEGDAIRQLLRKFDALIDMQDVIVVPGRLAFNVSLKSAAQAHLNRRKSNLVSATKVFTAGVSSAIIGHCPDSLELSFYLRYDEGDSNLKIPVDCLNRNRKGSRTMIRTDLIDSGIHFLAPQVLRQFISSFDYHSLGEDVLKAATEAEEMKPFTTYVSFIEGLSVADEHLPAVTAPVYHIRSAGKGNDFVAEVQAFVADALAEPETARDKVLEVKSFRLASHKKDADVAAILVPQVLEDFLTSQGDPETWELEGILPLWEAFSSDSAEFTSLVANSCLNHCGAVFGKSDEILSQPEGFVKCLQALYAHDMFDVDRLIQWSATMTPSSPGLLANLKCEEYEAFMEWLSED